MTVSLKHKFVDNQTDTTGNAVNSVGPGPIVGPNAWDSEHDLTLASGKLLGRTTAGAGAVEEIDIGAWIAYTPTVTPATGAFTVTAISAAYKQIGKTVDFRITYQVTDNGTATGYHKVSLPVAILSGATIAPHPCFNGGLAPHSAFSSGANGEIRVFTTAGGLPAISTFYISGTYEAA